MTWTRFWTDAAELRLFGIGVDRWLVALGAALAAWLALTLLRRALLRRFGAVAARTATQVDDTVVALVGATRTWVLAALAVLVGVELLELPPRWAPRVSQLWFVVVVVQLALWVSRALGLFMQRQLARHATPESSASATLLSWGLHTALWTVALLAVLANLGVNITAFVTSLGIGGIAVALAVQNILGDLFASLAIALDKPFEVGDAITVGNVSGTVERVGLKTTRLRAPAGEQVVMSNAEILKAPLNNYKRQTTRRIEFRFAVSLATPAAQAGEIPGVVKRLLEAEPGIRFDRAHLKRVAENGIEYEVVYIVERADYGFYMDLQQRFFLNLMRELQTLGVEFAVPRSVVTSLPPPNASPAPA